MMAAVYRKGTAVGAGAGGGVDEGTKASTSNGMPRNESYTCVQEPFITEQNKSIRQASSNEKTSSMMVRGETLGEKVKFANVV